MHNTSPPHPRPKRKTPDRKKRRKKLHLIFIHTFCDFPPTSLFAGLFPNATSELLSASQVTVRQLWFLEIFLFLTGCVAQGRGGEDAARSAVPPPPPLPSPLLSSSAVCWGSAAAAADGVRRVNGMGRGGAGWGGVAWEGKGHWRRSSVSDRENAITTSSAPEKEKDVGEVGFARTPWRLIGWRKLKAELGERLRREDAGSRSVAR